MKSLKFIFYFILIFWTIVIGFTTNARGSEIRNQNNKLVGRCMDVGNKTVCRDANGKLAYTFNNQNQTPNKNQNQNILMQLYMQQLSLDPKRNTPYNKKPYFDENGIYRGERFERPYQDDLILDRYNNVIGILKPDGTIITQGNIQ